MIESDINKSLKDKVFEDLEPIISGLGYSIVELKIGFAKKETHITVAIYKPDGVGIDDCTVVSRAIQERFEFYDEIDKFILRVTSPGIDRVIENKREYGIFINKGVRVLLKDNKEWTGGIIKEVTDSGIILQTKTESMNIEYTAIKKAKLDYTEEVGDK
ncbi:MAG: hypothetical protein JXJ04_12335 [Spirochaetales bacterium]|nr:hypothetical protein [Spirochaetales bacterium]